MANTSNQRLPLFVVAGMPRGATTFLYHYLYQHPDVYLPFRKEVNYFNTNYGRGEDWYYSLYSGMTDEVVAGDISAPCFLDEKSIDRIKQYRDDVKVILVIRNPVEWAVSFYHQFKSFSYDLPALEEYLANGYSSKIGDQYLPIRFSGHWISDRIKKFQEKFGDSILLYEYEFFKSNPLLILQQIEDFLGVRKYFTPETFDNKRINASNRRNVRFVSWLLSRERFIGFLAQVMPEDAIKYCRSIYDQLCARDNKNLGKHDEQEIRIAMKYLAHEVDAINLLFKDGPVLRGNRAVKIN